MAKSQGWQEVLCPWLTTKLNQSFPDPTQSKEEKEFLYAAITASLFKKVIAEILQYVDGQEKILKDLTKKKLDKVNNKFAIGG